MVGTGWPAILSFSFVSSDVILFLEVSLIFRFVSLEGVLPRLDSLIFSFDSSECLYLLRASDALLLSHPNLLLLFLFPIGVLIYWSTTNFWTWGQQFYVIKRNPTPGSPAWEELQAKKAKKSGQEPEAENNGGGVAIEEPKPTGQREQPKKKKKKRRK